MKKVAEALKQRGVSPSIYLSSSRLAAVESCRCIADTLGSDRRGAPSMSPALTPPPPTPKGAFAAHAWAWVKAWLQSWIPGRSTAERVSSVGGVDDLGRELKGLGASAFEVILLVGHAPGLDDLLTELTGGRSRPLESGSVVGVEGESLVDLLKGNGKIDFRFPVVDHGEKELREKAQSKMTISTFLAGFVFSALIEVLLSSDHPLNTQRQAAAIVLTLSLALFVGAIYIYDQLSMPPGFWNAGPRLPLMTWLRRRRERAHEKRWQKICEVKDVTEADKRVPDVTAEGPVFVTMVETSRFLFTPGVLLALGGFAAIVLDAKSSLVDIGAGLSLGVAVLYYVVRRPSLGVD
jgi:phosphohistidine phosphatase SixA